MNEPTKIYAPISAKQITFQSGKSILKLGINVEKFTAFLKQHANAKGYVNLGISERKEASQYGETHTAWLDTWSPGEKSVGGQPAAQERPVTKPTTTPYAGKQSDDVPF